MGLEQSGADYLGASTLLKVLVRHGVAKDAGKVNSSRRGRKSVVYDLPDPIVLPIPQMVEVPATIPAKPEPEEVVEEVVEAEEPVEAVLVSAEPQQYTYDYGDEDDDE